MFHTATMQDLKNMGKEILKLTTEVAIEIDGVEASVLDSFILRFPKRNNYFYYCGDAGLHFRF